MKGQISSEQQVRRSIAQLKTYELDSALGLIRKQIWDACDEEPNCLFENYYRLVRALEDTFDIPAAIGLSLQAIEVLKVHGKPMQVADFHEDVYRFYDAVNLKARSNRHLDSSLAIAKAENDNGAYIKGMTYRITTHFSVRPSAELLTEFRALIQDALEEERTGLALFMMQELNQMLLRVDSLEQLEQNIILVENYIQKIDDTAYVNSKMIRVATDFARLYIAQGDIIAAKKALKDGVYYSRIVPDKWTEIESLQKLAKFAIQEDSLDLAMDYLKRAEERASPINLYDRLSVNYLLLNELALKQKDYKRAYESLKTSLYYDSLLTSRNSSFNAEKYYLELEKKQLTQLKTEKELALSLSETRFKLVSVVTVAAVVLAALFFWAFRYNRRAAMELQTQNSVIKQQSDKLKATDKLKAQFFANISHELRTPLTLLLGPVSRLSQDESLNPKQSQLVQTAKKSVDQLKSLVTLILDFGKLENQNLKLEPSSVALKSYFQNYLTQFDSLASQKKVDYQFELNVDENIWVELDAEKTRQILYNLLSNAFKFTPSGGQIKLSLQLIENDLLVLKVVDTGMGISEEDQQRIFERYFQSTDPAKNKIGGTGIGLALCAEYAELMDGKVEVQSAIGKGSSFKLSLKTKRVPPLANEQATIEDLEENESTAQLPAKEVDHSKPRLLLVEDNVDLQQYIDFVLNDDFNISIAENGQVALDFLAEDSSIDLIITDLMMPIMNGHELVKNLKKSNKTEPIPILMLTARTDKETRLNSLRFGVDDYMTKPFEEHELLVRVQNLINRSKVRRETEELVQDEQDSQKPNDLELGNHSKIAAEDQAWLNEFEAYLRERFNDSSLKVPNIAADFSMSESSLQRKLKRLVGLTPKQYLRDMRLDHGRMLLETSINPSIKNIAAQAGYSETRSFSRSYFKRFGKNPSDYS
ncbi:MAG: ATP-binding protein [Bacteroidetes bacterium]|nr:ATP-binding protein [Bacteroidota bacterium]